MYTSDSIEEVKGKMDIVQVIERYITLKKRGANYVASCPFHDDKTPSFYVSPPRQKFKCFSCGLSGDGLDFIQKKESISYPEALKIVADQHNITLEEEGNQTYVRPVFNNKTDLSDAIVKYFAKRKISQKTLLYAKVTEGVEDMPTKEGFVKMNTIQFNYFRGGELVNTKYRGAKKKFKLVKGAELILYNIDSLIGKTEAYITEGCPDALSLIEAGYITNNCGVVSVPNGASKDRNNLIYINNSWEQIKHIEKWHLGLDNDSNGRKLRDELSERFGKDKCDYIEWKDKKDANEVLVNYGIQGVIDCCSTPIKFPLEGAFTISDFSFEIDDMYVNGLNKGISTGLKDFSLRFVPGYVTGITGISSHGKSEATDELTLRLTLFKQQNGAFYSPENKPTQLHYSKMARRIIGKNWDGDNRITKEEEHQVRKRLENHIFFIKPEKDFSLKSILNSIKDLKQRHGLDYFVIDAWNKLEHKGGNDVNYIGNTLDYLTAFCELEQIHCFLVAHPKKMEKDKKTGKFNVPTPYDVSGSADFYNKLDNWISIYLDRETNISTFHIQKVKFSHWGWISSPQYKWDPDSGRYFKEGFPDFTNWITGKVNTKPINPNELPLEDNIIIHTDNEEEPF